MKELLIIRHGKAERPTSHATDFERHLVQRGIADAKIVADHIKLLHWIPENIVSSSAHRAKETAIAMQSVWGAEVVEINFEPELYLADYSKLLFRIGQLNAKYDRIALIGHNAGFSDLVSGLCNAPVWLSTASSALIRFQVDRWEEIISETGTLIQVLVPKELRG